MTPPQINQPPQQRPPQQPNGQQVYPASRDQAEKFFIGAIKEIHATASYGDRLKDRKVPLSIRIGALAGQALVNMFGRVREQTGLQVSQEFVIHAIKVIVTEIGVMAEKIGEKPNRKDMSDAIKLAGDNLEQTMAEMEKQPQQDMPQSGLIDEAMTQRPPQRPSGLMDEAMQGGR